ncbi:MAG: hypothetical protein AAGG75_26765 [Bacteroidota bacterium]
MRLTLLFCFFLCVGFNSSAQKFIQLEKTTSLKTKRFYIGETLTFRLNGDKYWYEDVIKDILVDDGLVVFYNRAVKVEDISAIKTYKDAGWSRAWAWRLWVFGGAYAFFNFVALPFDLAVSINALTWQVPSVALIAGLALRLIFKSKKYKIGKKRRLRLMDLEFTKPFIKP